MLGTLDGLSVSTKGENMLFNFTWTWYEDYWSTLFEHPTKTRREFRKDCIRALREVGNKYIDEEQGWISANGWMESTVSKLLEYGYVIPQQAGFMFFGGYILDDKEIHNRETRKWGHIVGKKLLDKAMQKNAKIEAKLRKRHE
jgi:hypothetical protein